jgi:ADP-ribose pyrophosphatase YjhB (NUDIX family)
MEEGEAPVTAAAQELERETGLKAAWLDLLLRSGEPRLPTEYSYVFLAEDPERT